MTTQPGTTLPSFHNPFILKGAAVAGLVLSVLPAAGCGGNVNPNLAPSTVATSGPTSDPTFGLGDHSPSPVPDPNATVTITGPTRTVDPTESPSPTATESTPAETPAEAEAKRRAARSKAASNTITKLFNTTCQQVVDAAQAGKATVSSSSPTLPILEGFDVNPTRRRFAVVEVAGGNAVGANFADNVTEDGCTAVTFIDGASKAARDGYLDSHNPDGNFIMTIYGRNTHDDGYGENNTYMLSQPTVYTYNGNNARKNVKDLVGTTKFDDVAAGSKHPVSEKVSAKASKINALAGKIARGK